MGRATGTAISLPLLGRVYTHSLRTQEQFLKDLADRNVQTASLSVFRQHPLLRRDDGRIVILDLQSVTDLLTSGVYWLLFDGLPQQRRETFRELWGRAFELYVT